MGTINLDKVKAKFDILYGHRGSHLPYVFHKALRVAGSRRRLYRDNSIRSGNKRQMLVATAPRHAQSEWSCNYLAFAGSVLGLVLCEALRLRGRLEMTSEMLRKHRLRQTHMTNVLECVECGAEYEYVGDEFYGACKPGCAIWAAIGAPEVRNT